MKRAVLLVLLLTGALTRGGLQGQSALITLSFSASDIEVGTPAVIDLLIDCQVESCAAADLGVEFDPQALHVDDIALGEFPTQTGNRGYLLEHPVDDRTAAFTLRYVTQDNGYPASRGTGILAHITVTALKEGTTELRFARALVAPLDGEPVFTAQTFVGTVVARPAQDLRILSVQFEAVVLDHVTVSGPDTEVVSETRDGETLQIEVKSQINPATELTIKAPGFLACTTPLSQTHTIRLWAGDVNDDGIIDVRDAAIISGTVSPTEMDQADVNRDGMVDILDLIHVGRNFGMRSGEC